MESNSLLFYLLLAAVFAAGILYIAFRSNVLRGRKHRAQLGRTDQTIRAEMDPEVHDRGTDRDEVERPERHDRPQRPGPGNLERFR